MAELAASHTLGSGRLPSAPLSRNLVAKIPGSLSPDRKTYEPGSREDLTWALETRDSTPVMIMRIKKMKYQFRRYVAIQSAGTLHPVLVELSTPGIGLGEQGIPACSPNMLSAGPHSALESKHLVPEACSRTHPNGP